MKETAFGLLPKSQHKISGYAKTAEEHQVALLKEHPKLLLMLAASFLFGFGFVFAAIYLIWMWLRRKRKLAPAD